MKSKKSSIHVYIVVNSNTWSNGRDIRMPKTLGSQHMILRTPQTKSKNFANPIHSLKTPPWQILLPFPAPSALIRSSSPNSTRSRASEGSMPHLDAGSGSRP